MVVPEVFRVGSPQMESTVIEIWSGEGYFIQEPFINIALELGETQDIRVLQGTTPDLQLSFLERRKSR